MADNKKYYYLKIKDNFFDGEEMIILQSMTDGYLYSDILMKLYLRSLKNNGKLMFKDVIPYTPEVLATVVRHQVGTVEKALKTFHQLGLIEVLDNGAIYMLDIQNFIGESSTEADRKRAYRASIENEKIKGLPGIGQIADKCPDKNPPEIEIEIEIEKKIEIKKELELNNIIVVPTPGSASAPEENAENTNKPFDHREFKKFITRFIEAWNLLDENLPKLISINPNTKRYGMLKARYIEYGEDDLMQTLEQIANSEFLKGYRTDFKITLDWLVKPSNFTKVLEGNYGNKGTPGHEKTETEKYFDKVDEWTKQLQEKYEQAPKHERTAT